MRIVFLIFNGVQSLDLLGPWEALTIANQLRPGSYELEMAGAGRSGESVSVTTASGVRLAPAQPMADPRGPIDTLVVPGGGGVHALCLDPDARAWVAAAAGRSRRVVSVCSGAFMLAAAGLLDGRRVTTHWDLCRRLQDQYPQVEVDPAPIFIKDGDLYTSAGITAGIDLTLALIEEDLGSAVALAVARYLVLYVRRPGGQAQFSAALAGQRPDRRELSELQDWIHEHLDADLSVDALARRTSISPRHFARLFTDLVGVTPAAYVAAVRLERARILLETTENPIGVIAERCGFGTVETMRRTFARRLQVSPGDYREHFAA
jgi:transcriptional regulator GlxA family with amidase domain